jgi:dTDP-4-dehydrorhamnose 3,5-epimerase
VKVARLRSDGAFLIEPRVFRDPRGYFLESYNEGRYETDGLPGNFVQDNLSRSTMGVVRGLHYQNPHPQGKLISVLWGTIFDVMVDIRIGSPTFGQWEGVYLTSDQCLQMYIPPGFAHGFAVISEEAIFSYKCTDYYSPECEGSVLWNDPAIGIEWPVSRPILSPKDERAPRLAEIPSFRLPQYAPQEAHADLLELSVR